MIAFVIGGAASGKSAVAESILAALPFPRAYVATMRPVDDESRARIDRHRDRRAVLGARTVELFCDERPALPEAGSSVLLDCMGNLVANIMWPPSESDADQNGAVAPLDAEAAAARVNRIVDDLARSAANLIVVGNDVFREPAGSAAVQGYVDALARAQAHAASIADVALEVVCGIPVPLKGELGSLVHDEATPPAQRCAPGSGTAKEGA